MKNRDIILFNLTNLIAMLREVMDAPEEEKPLFSNKPISIKVPCAAVKLTPDKPSKKGCPRGPYKKKNPKK